jgi:peptidyl-prolyl cis-trans isomerase A (cyclophilin A)/peptidyl-prolyl cis-trans isomerase B (cyclophilin B)
MCNKQRKLTMKKLLLAICACSSVVAFADTKACATPQVELDTNMGKIVMQLDAKKAPLSVANFEQYVKSGFYKGKIFHRVIPGFMIQGGGFDEKMAQASTKAPIKNEANNGLLNDKYTVAMARTQDPDSATAQFFINVNDNAFLNYSAANPGYAVFGKVVSGQKVVDAIAGVPTATQGMNQNVPTKAVIIKSAKMLACGK